MVNDLLYKEIIERMTEYQSKLDYDTMVNNKWIKLSFKMHKMGDYCPEKWIKVRG